MADEKRYLVPRRTTPRVYPNLSQYLQTVGHYAPVLASKSLPSKVVASQKPAEKPKKKEPQWIELELVGEDGKRVMVAYRYVIELPDGKKKEGFLSNGRVKLTDPAFEPGQTLKVSFPDLDEEFWEKV